MRIITALIQSNAGYIPKPVEKPAQPTEEDIHTGEEQGMHPPKTASIKAPAAKIETISKPTPEPQVSIKAPQPINAEPLNDPEINKGEAQSQTTPATSDTDMDASKKPLKINPMPDINATKANPSKNQTPPASPEEIVMRPEKNNNSIIKYS